MLQSLIELLVGGACYFLGLTAAVLMVDGPTGFDAWYGVSFDYHAMQIPVFVFGFGMGTYLTLDAWRELNV